MEMKWIDLANKVAVVTGGGSGIGQGIAIGLADAGATVVVLDRDEVSTRTVDDIKSRGGQARFLRCDVTDEHSVAEAAAESFKALGATEILVNNAGTLRAGSLGKLSLSDWQANLTLNLTGYFICAQAFGAQMLEKGGGAIVHIASVSAHFPQNHSGAYSASKAAVLMLSQQLATEWGPRGVRSNVVSPGLIRTPMTKAIYDTPGVLEARRAAVPRGRIGEPQDVANAVVFLASNRADYVSGAEIVVDGGLTRGIMNLIPRPGYDAT
jgi:NAD(P)-dependent dehydrogenase (short-subunit alcohol dehydrogenase family)